MNNWTISRRVIAGFAVMLLIIVALGVFALWRLTGLAQNVADLADRSLPSVLLLNEASKVSRGNLIDLLQIDADGVVRAECRTRTKDRRQYGAPGRVAQELRRPGLDR